VRWYYHEVPRNSEKTEDETDNEEEVKKELVWKEYSVRENSRKRKVSPPVVYLGKENHVGVITQYPLGQS